MNLDKSFQPPSSAHFFGLDQFGQDYFTKLFSGAQYTIFVSITVTSITIAIGLAFAVLISLNQGWLRTLLYRFIDIMLSFPSLLVAILLSSILPNSLSSLIFVLSVSNWAGFARFFAGILQKTMKQGYVESAYATGATQVRLMRVHVLPDLYSQLLIQSLICITQTILAEASLSFLGLGGGANENSWGRLIAEGRLYMVEAPHLSIIPGILLVAMLAFFQILITKLQKTKIR